MSVGLWRRTRVRGMQMLLAGSLIAVADLAAQIDLHPNALKPLGRVGPRFVSYNIEAVEVTGGRFWAPYKTSAMAPAMAVTPGGLGGIRDANDGRFQYRPPIDLANPKLRRLAAALGPAYLRVSGSWRNSMFFQDDDLPAMKTAPAGFQGVLTRARWKEVVEFAKAVDGALVTSVATSAGTHDDQGVWTTDQARRWLDYTRAIGGHIAATEYMNEPTIMNITGVAGRYGAEEYARDSLSFEELLRKESPGTLFLGPSAASEGVRQTPRLPGSRIVPSAALMSAIGPRFDGFSYHMYYTRSRRCSRTGDPGTDDLLTAEYLDRAAEANAYFSAIRDKYLPGKDLWLTETGEASCGGDRWAAQYVDAFRLIDQFGTLAQRGVQSVMYNTLASSDYGMLDEQTLEPRPNYWAALLWKRIMGTQSLEPALPKTPTLRAYAQCLQNVRGGVAFLLLNLSGTEEKVVHLPTEGELYTLSAPNLFGTAIDLNGRPLRLTSGGEIPRLKGAVRKRGSVVLAPLTITFIALPESHNTYCSQ